MEGISITDLKPCFAVQQYINADTDLNGANYLSPETPFYNFLTSARNKNASTAKIIQNFNGKYKNAAKLGEVNIQYYEEECEPQDEITVNRCSDNTTTVTHNGRVTKQFYTDLSHTISFKMNRDGNRDNCYSLDELKQELIASFKRTELYAFDKKIAESLLTAVGGYYGQTSPATSITAPKSIKVIDEHNNFNVSAFSLLENEFEKKDFIGDIQWFADRTGRMSIAAKNKKFAVANTTTGVDSSKLDVMFDAVKGFNSYNPFGSIDDHILGIPLGSYQLIEWYANAGEYNQGATGIIPGTNFYNTRMDLFGMTWDVKFERHGCDDLWFFTKNIGVVPIPTGACNDRLALHFLAACGDTSCAGLSAIL